MSKVPKRIIDYFYMETKDFKADYRGFSWEKFKKAT